MLMLLGPRLGLYRSPPSLSRNRIVEDTDAWVLGGGKTAISAARHRKPLTVEKAQAWDLISV